MEKSGEAPEAPVTRPWRDLSWRGICSGMSAPDAAPIARRAHVESARNAPIGPHNCLRAKGWVIAPAPRGGGAKKGAGGHPRR